MSELEHINSKFMPRPYLKGENIPGPELLVKPRSHGAMVQPLEIVPTKSGIGAILRNLIKRQ